ncbi:ribonuclease HII [Candidatus Campbellbacteria bacterium CG11_big_fil_rev_8_21_14_0_20_44_21]|uniref:Ribonuclease n=1 Tax=Candidatus Campbellbacteria bacterium CG22_combo_CG10-13_8_21_14_all_43_18 TaxID=1974530 RepID=A0A2H0DWN1_9BACT|nr:MAG: ribonuclease HII [Candidatus Campbellbacteria bacterium CG22_combo_CG10-13_8_21_14_all_43_18]PIR24371.1 MAG: ribonuclease HII [Candidatus Campbellbacteria bacterium CG11_big_fil_rev_8_21_14_0_20_44_21]
MAMGVQVNKFGWKHHAIIAKMERCIIGIDEAGRGPLAGPVCAGLVAWRPAFQAKILKELPLLTDSKKLSPKRRAELFKKIKKLKKQGLLFYTHTMANAEDIDEGGIVKCLQTTIRLCLERAENFFEDSGRFEILLDGLLRAPEKYSNQKTIIKGDQKEKIISAASIVAKVARDDKMKALAKKYPAYGFEKHKGYGTREHYQKIKKFGLSPIHRKTFTLRTFDF